MNACLPVHIYIYMYVCLSRSFPCWTQTAWLWATIGTNRRDQFIAVPFYAVVWAFHHAYLFFLFFLLSIYSISFFLFPSLFSNQIVSALPFHLFFMLESQTSLSSFIFWFSLLICISSVFSCNTGGFDLNRCWTQPSDWLQPTIAVCNLEADIYICVLYSRVGQ